MKKKSNYFIKSMVKMSMKKKILLVITIIFSVLTFLGAGYVLINHGTVSAGYAVVPMVFGIVFGQWYRKLYCLKNDSKKNDKKESGIAVGMCLGVGIGVSIGTVTDNLSFFISIGIGVGTLLGILYDHKNNNK